MAQSNINQPSAIKVWDLTTRIWHWAIALLIVFLWYSAEIADNLMEWHLRAGRLMLALIVFRIIWGFIGSDTAKFKNFIRAPGQVLSELKQLFGGQALTPAVGHNPAGGWMVVLLIAIVGAQALTGLFTSDGYYYEGPWVAWLSERGVEIATECHHTIFTLIKLAVAVHILAIVLHRLRGESLLPAMFTGKKSLAHTPPNLPRHQWRSPWLALAIFAACLGVIWFATKPAF